MDGRLGPFLEIIIEYMDKKTGLPEYSLVYLRAVLNSFEFFSYFKIIPHQRLLFPEGFPIPTREREEISSGSHVAHPDP